MCPAQIISPSSLSDTRDYYLVTYLPRVASKDYHTWSSYYKPQSVIGYTHMSVILKSLPVLIKGHPRQTGVWFRLPCTCHQPGGPYFKTAPVFYTPHYILSSIYSTYSTPALPYSPSPPPYSPSLLHQTRVHYTGRGLRPKRTLQLQPSAVWLCLQETSERTFGREVPSSGLQGPPPPTSVQTWI